jgi:hypothetical protein
VQPELVEQVGRRGDQSRPECVRAWTGTCHSPHLAAAG